MPKAEKVKVSAKQKPIHPLSRKAQVLTKNAAREHRLNQNYSNTAAKNDVIAQKIFWFQDEVDKDKKDFTKRDLVEYTKKYLKRFDEELNQIDLIKSVGNRQGQQHVSRKSAINLSLERDNQMIDSVGLEVPDIINGKHLDDFRNWDGNVLAIKNMKFRKITRKDIDESLNESIKMQE